jgi:hypothetical protein
MLDHRSSQLDPAEGAVVAAKHTTTPYHGERRKQ